MGSRAKRAVGLLKKTASQDKDRQIKELQKQVKSLEEILASHQESVDRQKKLKFQLPSGRQRTSKGSFVRLLVPDTHGSFIDKAAAAAMLEDAKSLDVREVVFLGDHIDAGGFMAQHHVLGYVAQAEYTFEEDVVAANTFLDSVQKACPKAKAWYLEGNHEVRIEKFCMTTALRSGVDAKFLLNHLSPQKQLHLENRGIQYVHTLDQSFNQGNSRGVLELGSCLFLHGFSHAKHATAKTLDDLGHNAVIAHIHRAQSATKTTHRGQISCWCMGCLCELRKYYNHSRPTHHSHGYGIQLVNKDGTFLHITVPIIDGKSFLRTLIKAA